MLTHRVSHAIHRLLAGEGVERDEVGKGYEHVIGRTLYYRNLIKKLLSSDRARIIIIAREITQNLKLAFEDIPDVQLFEYTLSMKLSGIN